jgi:pimeloyl-ACP methyl ester carboxylesterase
MKVIIRQSLKLLQTEIDFSMIYPYISVWNYSEEYLEKIIELPNYSNPYNDRYMVNRSVVSKLLYIADELENYKGCIEKVRCPVLVIGAENDSVLPFERQQELFKNRSGFEVKIVSGSSHSAIFENSNEVNAYIQEFLDRYN